MNKNFAIACMSLLLFSQDAQSAELKSKHFLFGSPALADARHEFQPLGDSEYVDGVTILERPGFVIGHYDKFKEPAWMMMRWTRQDCKKSEAVKAMPRNFKMDLDLPKYARGKKDFKTATSKMQLGHMAKHEDNRAWGRTNSDFGNRLSNICPQHEDLNPKEWKQLEDLHHSVVKKGSVSKIWIIAGPIFDTDKPKRFVANEVAVPNRFYKVIAWMEADDKPHAVGYIFDNKKEKVFLKDCKHSVKEIEDSTGLIFFPYMNAQDEAKVKNRVNAGLWTHE